MEYNKEKKAFIMKGGYEVTDYRSYENYYSLCSKKKITPENIGGYYWTTKHIADIMGEKKILILLLVCGVLRKSPDVSGYFVCNKFKKYVYSSMVVRFKSNTALHNLTKWNTWGVFLIKEIIERYRENLEDWIRIK